jgi:holo-[acyl-carrier protein] synthase
MVFYCGIEIVKTAWIKLCLEQSGEQFEQHYFTVAERQMSKVSADRIQYFASRLAAKIAVLKALEIQQSAQPLWHDIEIQRLPNGQPTAVLSARCQELATERGITTWLLSLSHTASYAAASAIALSTKEFITNELAAILIMAKSCSS